MIWTVGYPIVRLGEQICNFFVATRKEKAHNASSREILWVKCGCCRRPRGAPRGGCEEVYVARLPRQQRSCEKLEGRGNSSSHSRALGVANFMLVWPAPGRCSVAFLTVLPRGKAMGGRREPEWWVAEEGVNSNDRFHSRGVLNRRGRMHV